MIVRAKQRGPAGMFICSTCDTSLEPEENIVGLIGKVTHNIYRCPCCQLLHWAPRPSRPALLAS
jgi:hypothetical protein